MLFITFFILFPIIIIGAFITSVARSAMREEIKREFKAQCRKYYMQIDEKENKNLLYFKDEFMDYLDKIKK